MPFATTSCRSFKPVGLPCRTIGEVVLGRLFPVEYRVYWIVFFAFVFDYFKRGVRVRPGHGTPHTGKEFRVRTASKRVSGNTRRETHVSSHTPVSGGEEVAATVRDAGRTQPHSAESLNISEDLERPRGRRIRPLHSAC
jgi:hypothetical protein